MRCPYCGAENPLGVEACLSCLHPLPVQHAETTNNVRYVAPGQDVGQLPLHVAKRALAMRAAGIKKVHHLTSPTSSTPSRPAPDLRPLHTRRSEPYLDGTTDTTVDPAANEWLRQMALIEHSAPAESKRRAFRLWYMIGVFVVGATVGLIAAWWMKPSSIGNSHLASLSTMARPVEQAKSRLNAENKGITPSELPYDGASSAAKQSVPTSSSVASIRPEELPYDGANSNSDTTHPKPQTSATPPLQQHPEHLTSSSPKEVPASSVQNTVRPSATRRDAHPQHAERRTAPKRVVQRSAKDKEIQRIKQQAAEELKKKTELSTAKPSSREGPLTKKIVSTRAQLERCERASNFILREQCKWRICGGKWGTNGCPSYQTHASVYMD